VERIKSGNVQIKKTRVEENVEQIMIFFCKNYTLKEKCGEAITKML
jgi:rRNA maturation protein Nop10